MKRHLLFLFLLFPMMLFSQEYFYDVVEGTKNSKEQWIVTAKEDGYVIEYINENEYWKSDTDKNFINRSLYIKNKSFEKLYTARDIENYDPDKELWMQNTINLSPIVHTSSNKVYFFSLSPKVDKKGNMSPNEIVKTNLVWIKGPVEKLHIANKDYQAIKMTLTLHGPLSIFWKASYWYDTESGILLKSEIPNAPGKPVKTSTLLSIQ